MSTDEEVVECEDCLYWNDDLEECELEKEPENRKCESYA